MSGLPAVFDETGRDASQQVSRIGNHCNGIWEAMVKPVLTGTRSP